MLSRLRFLILLWIGLDFFFGIPIAWKISRTEAWIRVGDPELHHAFRPMSHQTEKYGPEQLPIFINSLGAKDESCREVTPVANVPRVAVFGDSFAEGWGLPFPETAAGQLREVLFPAGVDVLGFGISSHCPSLTERWIQKLLREGVRWDLAVLLIDPGDSYDEMDVRSFLSGNTTMKRKDTPRFFRLRWYEYSLTYQFFRQFRERLFQPPLKWDLERATRGNEHKIVWLDDPEKAPWLRDGLEQSAAAVRGIRAKAQHYGFPILIVIYPYPRMMVQRKMQNEYTEFWTAFTRQEGIPLLDLTPLFAQADKTVEQIYAENFLPGDFHWNATGSARVAEALLPLIREKMPSRAALPGKNRPP